MGSPTCSVRDRLDNNFWYRLDGRMGLQSSLYGREQRYAPHRLGEYVFVYCTEGELVVEEAGQRVVLRPGEALVGNARRLRKSRYRPGAAAFRGLTVICEEEEVRGLLGATRRHWASEGVPQFEGNVQAPDLMPVAAMLAARVEEGRPQEDPGLAGGAQLLLSELLNRWPDGQLLHNREPRVRTLRRSEYVRAHLLMQSTPKSEFSVPDLCRRIGTSPARFYRLFEATTGLAPLAYFNSLLAVRAARLMRNEAGSVKAVSLELGFRCESQFSRLFRHFHGVTPDGYRKKRREDAISPSAETLREIHH